MHCAAAARPIVSVGERVPAGVGGKRAREGALSAGPKSVAPVSRPETVSTAECMRCSTAVHATTRGRERARARAGKAFRNGERGAAAH